MKKVFAMLLALMMVMSLATTAFASEVPGGGEGGEAVAAPDPVTLTVEGYKTGHTYEAYQIFTGAVADGFLQGIQWGDGVDEEALVAALKADATLGTAFAEADANNPVSVANVLATFDNDSEQLDAFAKILNDHLVAEKAVTSTEGANKIYSFTLLPGYYFIKDKDPAEGAGDLIEDFYTKFIIALTSKTDVKVKGSVPTVTKQVSHNLANNYGEYISNQLEKTHYYQWWGTISADIDDYDEYHYEFVDTMSDGLDFIRFEQIFIQHTGDAKTVIYDASLGEESAIVRPILMPNTYKATENADGTTTVKVVWEDLLHKYPTLLSSDKIYVRYSAKLNNDAIIGEDGNPNEVYLIYSNDPSDKDEGRTNPVDPRVYSFELDVLKRDEVTKVALENAKFVLYHQHTNTADDSLTNMYAILDSDFRLTGWTDDETKATVLTTGEDGKIKVTGIQANLEYFLKETEAPTGYNKLSAPIKIMITSYTLDAAEKIDTISYTVGSTNYTAEGDTAEDGKIPVTVNNRSGSVLPSTGGMGTTLFYVLGGILFVGAAVLLVTKKRMAQ